MPAASREDVPVALNEEQIEIRSIEWGGMEVSFGRLPPGDYSFLFKGLPDDQCHVPHWGVCLKGKGYLHTREGEVLITAGMAFYTPPGHTLSVIETMESIEFTPLGEANEQTAEVVMRNLASFLSARRERRES